jgi:processive 1,2-diacylglycerol beta-glucosyltransferase
MQADSMKTVRTIAIVYSDAASGPLSAATALKNVLQNRNPQCHVRLVNIAEIFDHHPLFGKIVRTGIKFFNWQLRNDSVAGLKKQINLMLFFASQVGKRGIRKIARYWEASPADIVVSVTPMYNPVLYRSAQLANPDVQCITVPVDFEEVCSNYWFTPAVKQYYLNGTARLQLQAAKAGIPEKERFRIDGMPVGVCAYECTPHNRSEQLRAIGLNPVWPVGFLSFGAQGSRNILAITKALAKQHRHLNLIIMCGRNKKLYKQVTALKLPFPVAVYTYLPKTPLRHLHLADFAIGKPGAMTITESLITQTPLIVQQSKGMRPIQQANEEWLKQAKTGIVASTPETIAAAVNEIVNNPVFKVQMDEHHHQALYQMAAFIEKLGKINQIYKPYLHVTA